MLLMINVIFYRMALVPWPMDIIEFLERHEHCIVHTVFEHYIVLFNLVVLTRYLLYLNIVVIFEH